MTAPPMRRWQNLAALAATILAAFALLPLRPQVRVVCSLLAAALILFMIVGRLRAHRATRVTRRTDDVYSRIERIRSARGRRRR